MVLGRILRSAFWRRELAAHFLIVEFSKLLTDQRFALHLPTLLKRAGQIRFVYKVYLVIFDN